MLSDLKSGIWILTALCSLLIVQPASAVPWYIVDGEFTDDGDATNDDKVLYDYNIGDTAASNPRTITVNAAANQITGLAVGPNKTLYAATSFGDDSLYTVDPISGIATLVGATGLNATIEGDLGFDRTTNTLYAIYRRNVGSNRGLYTLSTTTGSATLVGNITGDDPSGLAFDSAGNLWVMDTNTNGLGNLALLQINKSTGATIQTISTNVTNSVIDTLGLDFDQNGVLYAAVDDGNFYSVNTVSGEMTIVDTHNTQATGLALVPEPSALALLLPIPLLALVWFLRRRKQMTLSRA